MKPLQTIPLIVVPLMTVVVVLATGHAPPRNCADDVWAEALWVSLPPNGGSSAEMSRLFVAAIDRAHRKAPIYVSFGDNSSGALKFHENLNAVIETIEANLGAVIEREAAESASRIDPDSPDESADAVMRILLESYRKTLDESPVQESLHQLVRLAHGKSEMSVACYVAAVAEEPDYLPAWYRIAAYADKERGAVAVGELQRRDPRNALGWYMAAILAAEDDDLPAALAAIETGNALPECRWYPSPFPRSFTFFIPTTPEMEELGLAGHRLTGIGLKLFVTHFAGMFAWADTFPRRLRTALRDKLLDDGKRLAAEGKYDEAVRRFAAIREVGMHFLCIEPQDARWVVDGLLFARLGNDGLQQCFETLGDSGNRRAAADFHQRLENFRGLFSKAIERPDPGPAERLASFLGQRDLLSEDEQRLEAALEQSGFIHHGRRGAQ